jgi:hypothetical protein
MKITNKVLNQQPSIHSTASTLSLNMHFRLLPQGRESRRQWYIVTASNEHEITAKPISGIAPIIRISHGTRILRPLSEDPVLR